MISIPNSMKEKNTVTLEQDENEMNEWRDDYPSQFYDFYTPEKDQHIPVRSPLFPTDELLEEDELECPKDISPHGIMGGCNNEIK